MQCSSCRIIHYTNAIVVMHVHSSPFHFESFALLNSDAYYTTVGLEDNLQDDENRHRSSNWSSSSSDEDDGYIHDAAASDNAGAAVVETEEEVWDDVCCMRQPSTNPAYEAALERQSLGVMPSQLGTNFNLIYDFDDDDDDDCWEFEEQQVFKPRPATAVEFHQQTGFVKGPSLKSVSTSSMESVSGSSAAGAVVLESKRGFGGFGDMHHALPRFDRRERASQLDDSSGYDLMAMKRPGFGTVGKKVELETNFFMLKIPAGCALHRYNVKVYQTKPVHINFSTAKANALEKHEHRAAIFAAYKQMIAEYKEVFKFPFGLYFNRANVLFAKERLEMNDLSHFAVNNVSVPGQTEKHCFNIHLEYLDMVELGDPQAVLRDSANKRELTPLGALDIVSAQAIFHNEDLLELSRGYYRPTNPAVNLHPGRMMYSGLAKANRAILGPWDNPAMLPPEGHHVLALNLITLKTAYYKPQPVLNFLADIVNMERGTFSRLRDGEFRRFKNEIRDIYVEADYRGGLHSKIRFAVKDITVEGVSEKKFMADLGDGKGERRITIMSYFEEKYGIKLRNPMLPCLVNYTKKKQGAWDPHYFPLELCSISANQRVPFKKTSPEQTKELIRHASIAPPLRRQEILESLRKDLTVAGTDGQSSGLDEYLQTLGIERSGDMMRCSGRIIDPPTIEYNESSEIIYVTPQYGVWDSNWSKFFLPAKCANWALVYFDKSGYLGVEMNQAIKTFCEILANATAEKGMEWPTYPKEDLVILRDVGEVRSTFRKLAKKFADDGGCLDMIVAVIPNAFKRDDAYAEVKYVGECLLDIPTQVLKPETIRNAIKGIGDANPETIRNAIRRVDQAEGDLAVKKKGYGTILNIMQKLNTKLGGINNRLTASAELIEKDNVAEKTIGFLKEKTLFLGADVTHGAPGEAVPSIAAVVGAITESDYRTVVQTQSARQEPITGMRDAVRELLELYLQHNGFLPEKIFMIRDGVSDGQFAEVLRREMAALKASARAVQADYEPKITFIIVQKRHQTRFFLTGDVPENAPIAAKNVQAGTVVDTGPVHPTRFEFYLVSHQGIQGTSRPSKYVVLHDDCAFTPDEVQHLVFYLCHNYSRCQRSVSIPTICYYAHIAAARAKDYATGFKNRPSRGDESSAEPSGASGESSGDEKSTGSGSSSGIGSSGGGFGRPSGGQSGFGGGMQAEAKLRVGKKLSSRTYFI